MNYEVKLKIVHDTGGQYSRGNITNIPSPTVLVSGCTHFVSFYRTNNVDKLLERERERE